MLWGLKVLAVDWDIEAPGLNHYFEKFMPVAATGVLDFLTDCQHGDVQDWKRYVHLVDLPDCKGALSLMPAAATNGGGDYTETVQNLDWDKLYSVHDLGGKLELLRANWIENYDIILIDSRTGITDFSGITTVQLPDFLLFFFTANHQSLNGCCDVARRAMEARRRLPLDRPALVPIPIPARFENREEYDRAKIWRAEFAEKLNEFFDVWVPRSLDRMQLIDHLTIPYVPRWTFGEDLAVLLEPPASNGTRTASSVASFALETLAALIASRLEKVDLLASSRDEFVLTSSAAAVAAAALRRPTEQNKFDVCISYMPNDIEIVRSLEDALQRRGLRVFQDNLLEAGSDWSFQIEDGYVKSDALIVVVGKVTSRAQQSEVETFFRHSLRAESEKRKFVVVLPGGIDTAKRMPYLSQVPGIVIDDKVDIQAQIESVVTRFVALGENELPVLTLRQPSRLEKTVFISYRRTNNAWALAIYQDLTHHGFDVFFDYQGIASGDFERVILENIRARAHFLVLLTPSALERCGDPEDWLRREIETAIEARRNIVPLMLEGFDFSTPSIAGQLTGKLAALNRYNALDVPARYFEAAMSLLREKFLNVPLEAVPHLASAPARQAAEAQQAAASAAPAVGRTELTAQDWFEQGFNASDPDEQIRCYSEAIRLKPGYARAYNNRGYVRIVKGDFDGALKDSTEAIRLDHSAWWAYDTRGVARFRKGDVDGAIKDYTEAIRIKPDHPYAYMYRGDARVQKGDFVGAIKDFDEAIRLKPDYANAYYKRGLAHRAQGNPASINAAIADFQKCVDLGGGIRGGDQTQAESYLRDLKNKL